MRKIQISLRDITQFLIVFSIASIFIFLGIFISANSSEHYNDIIIESVASLGSNITGELKTFWTILFMGIFVFVLINYFTNKKKITKEKNKNVKSIIGIETVLIVGNSILYLTLGTFNKFLLICAIVTFIDYLISPGKEKKGLVLTVIIYYFLLSLNTIYNYIGIELLLNSTLLIIVTAITNIILFCIDKKVNIINKTISIMQIFIPFILLLYICERYLYNDKIIYQEMPVVAKIVILSMIISMFIYSIYKLIKKWKNIDTLELNKLVLSTTCLVIFAVNSVDINTGLVVPADLHHSGENVISYQQILEKGQIPYQDYSPVSGLFPVLIGGVLESFGGDITAYNLAHAVYMILFAMATMYVLTKHLDKEKCLFVAFLVCFADYDRIVFIWLSLLILLLPKLINNRNLWLKCWMILSFIGGLYYPTFGGALLIGTLPFAIVQFLKFIKEDSFKDKLKSPFFYIGWIICFVPIVFSLPLLFKMAKHILIYSAQTKLADGITVWGQEVPEYFMSYITNLNIRTAIYYVIRYVIPISIVWIFVVLILKTLKRKQIKEEIQTQRFLLLSASIIVLLVSYTATMVRNDVGLLANRSQHIIGLVGGILLYIAADKYFNNNIQKYIIIGVILGIMLITDSSGLRIIDNKFLYSHQIDSSYQLITEELEKKYPRLGKGFIGNKEYNKLEDQYERAYSLLEYDENLKFLIWTELGGYYTLDLTTVGQPSSHAAKDYKTHKEIIDAIKEQKPVVGTLFAGGILGNYYLYKWLLTSDEYVYDFKYKAFLPIELFRKIYGENADINDVEEKIEGLLYTTYVGLIPSSIAPSLNNLSDVIKKQEVLVNINEEKLISPNLYQYNIELDQTILGVDSDFLYIEFEVDGDINKKQELLSNRDIFKSKKNLDINVVVRWGDEEKDSMTTVLEKGKLLIPLGANINWLLNKHDDFTIEVQNINKKLIINDMQFYKLRNVE